MAFGRTWKHFEEAFLRVSGWHGLNLDMHRDPSFLIMVSVCLRAGRREHVHTATWKGESEWSLWMDLSVGR